MRLCSVCGCDKKHFGKGYCNLHYNRFRRHGDPTVLNKDSHGLTDSAEYRVWQDMKTRCSNKSHKSYNRYGGRGIHVCARWENSFSSFYKDMGNKPSKIHQLDRIDNDKGYSKENCQWITPTENVRKGKTPKLNVEKVKEIKRIGKTIPQPEIAEMFGVVPHTISDILRGRTWRDVSCE